MSSFWRISKVYPYTNLSQKPLLLQYVWLRLFPRRAFPAMSIEPLAKSAYRLSGRLEFLVRYFVSRIGFEELWTKQSRATKEEIEHFYQEHDKDIWRQAYMSIGHYEYKKKILRVRHLVRAAGVAKNDPILDYGGGAGVLVHYLAAKGYTSVDIADIPSQTLDFVRKTMAGTLRRIIAVDGSEVFPAGEYAAIISLDCLEHTYEPLTIMQRLLTSLRPGGLLVLNFPKETDFSHAHLERAQRDRDAVFALIDASCDTLVPQFVYRKHA